MKDKKSKCWWDRMNAIDMLNKLEPMVGRMGGDIFDGETGERVYKITLGKIEEVKSALQDKEN